MFRLRGAPRRGQPQPLLRGQPLRAARPAAASVQAVRAAVAGRSRAGPRPRCSPRPSKTPVRTPAGSGSSAAAGRDDVWGARRKLPGYGAQRALRSAFPPGAGRFPRRRARGAGLAPARPPPLPSPPRTGAWLRRRVPARRRPPAAGRPQVAVRAAEALGALSCPGSDGRGEAPARAGLGGAARAAAAAAACRRTLRARQLPEVSAAGLGRAARRLSAAAALEVSSPGRLVCVRRYMGVGGGSGSGRAADGWKRASRGQLRAAVSGPGGSPRFQW